jgi:hypothetical protein
LMASTLFMALTWISQHELSTCPGISVPNGVVCPAIVNPAARPVSSPREEGAAGGA